MDNVKASVIAEGKYGLLSVYTEGEDIDETIAKPLYSFLIGSYMIIGIWKRAMMFDALKEEVGKRTFIKFWRSIIEKIRLRISVLQNFYMHAKR